MTDQKTMTVEWKSRTRKVTEVVESSVELTDAPDITANGGPCRPYSIRARFTRFNGGPWQPEITIYAMFPGHVVGGYFGPDKVYMPPQWLTDLIAEAAPDA